MFSLSINHKFSSLVNQSVENTGVAFVKGANEGNEEMSSQKK